MARQCLSSRSRPARRRAGDGGRGGRGICRPRPGDLDPGLRGRHRALSSAESAGVGVRVISGRSKAFPTSGPSTQRAPPRPSPRRATTPASRRWTNMPGLASPDGIEPPSLDLWREELAAFPTDDKVALALELDRRVRAGDPAHPPGRLVGLRRRSRGDGDRDQSRHRRHEPPHPLLPVRSCCRRRRRRHPDRFRLLGRTLLRPRP